MSGEAPRPLDSERWARVEALFHEAVDLPEAERASFLDASCGNDTDLRRAVQRFLEADSAGDGVVDGSLEDLAGPFLIEPESGGRRGHLEPGTEVGPYRIAGVLGEGGMGTVYRAERADGAFERTVAIKLVRTGRLEGLAELRFERERQILARLSHPGIATLLDGGVTDGGEPYLVMELVEGEPITDFAQRKHLDIRARLQLIIRVAEAVQHAHANFFVHRDLKPSNILVRESGEVKLLDFGIAHLMQEAPEDGATQTGVFLLTPDYAAPEQVRGEVPTTAVDVYGIGAVLYELLALRRPFGRLTSRWSDLERILDEPPPPLSSAEGLDGVTRRALDGDLETIVQTALHKEPARRYATARDLAEDLQRHLDGRPVRARADSRLYRLSKFVRRNTAASVAGAAFLVAVVLGAAGTLSQAREARLEAERGEAVGGFLFSLFEGADPDLNPGDAVTAVELLEAGAARVDSLDAGVGARVDLLTTLGVLFGKLGRYERSEALLRNAVDEASSGIDEADPAVSEALDALGVRLGLTGDLEESERLLREALRLRESYDDDAARVAATRGNLGLTLRRRGQHEEAARLYESAIEALAAEAGADSLAYASELMGLAQVYQFEGQFGEAEALFRVVRRLKEESGSRDPFLGRAIHNLGVVVATQERYEEAEQIHTEALGVWMALFPDGHPEIARSYEALGRVAERSGRWEDADSLYREAVDRWTEQYGAESSQIATIRANQANLRYFQGDFVAAAEAYRDGVRIWRANDERHLLAAGLRNLGVIQREAGDLTSADTLLFEALSIRRELNGDLHETVAETQSAIAGLRNQQGRYAEGEEFARLAVDRFQSLYDENHRLTVNASMQLGHALAEQGRYTEASTVLEHVLERFLETRNEADAAVGRARLWLGVALAAEGETERARRLIEDAVPVLENGLGADAPETRRAKGELRRHTR